MSSEKPRAGNRILIVDDHRHFGELLGEIARTEGFEVLVSEKPQEFLDQLERFRPSVVSVDLMMPEVDGIELLRELAVRRCEASVFVTSGVDLRTLTTVRSLGREFGLKIAGLIPKPVRVAQFREMLEGVKVDPSPVTAEAFQEALDEDRIFLVYQPKVDLRSGRITGAEALARWRLPNGDLLHPDSFMPMVEKSGLSDALTGWVLEQAIEDAAAWHHGGTELRIAVNLSGLNLQDRSLPERILQICESRELPPSALTLELTETATMQDTLRMMDVFVRLRVRGFELSIDDFGTGYSSLVQLQRLPFSEIKIDRSFVVSMLESSDSRAIVRAVIELGHALDLSVVAEGVESELALLMLAEMRCDVAQGFFISEPLTTDGVAEFAATWALPDSIRLPLDSGAARSR
jgi:EAL domain-containing protein (putative c-di-GMP-specific phosphodiesterase class I)